MRYLGIFDQGDDSGVPLDEHLENRLVAISLADRAGLYGYHLAEHHGSNFSLIPSQFAFLVAAAQRSRKIRLGTLIHVATFHPAIRIAEDFCMLDSLSQGRAMLGMGSGGSPAERAIFNAPIDQREFAERARDVSMEVRRLLDRNNHSAGPRQLSLLGSINSASVGSTLKNGASNENNLSRPRSTIAVSGLRPLLAICGGGRNRPFRQVSNMAPRP